MAKHVLVNKQTAAVSSSQVLVSTAASPAALTDGQLAIYNADTNAALAEGTSYGLIPFYVAMGVPSGRNPRISPVIKAGAVKKIEFKSYTAPVQPIYFVGYTGSGSNTINFLASSGTASTSYGIKIENLVTLAPPFPKAYSQYTLRAAAGTVNNNPVYVADQIAKDLNQQLSVMPSIDGGQFAIVDVIADNTSFATATAPATGTSLSCTLVNGASTFTIVDTTNITNATALAQGCWIRIGSSSGASTAPIYQIANVVATSPTVTTVTLTRPYYGADQTTITNMKVANAITVLPTSTTLTGLKISVTGSYFTSNAYAAGKLNNMINIPLMDTLAGTPITLGTSMVYGSGTVSEVLKKEMQALGEMGVENRIWMPLPNDTYAASNVGTGGGAAGNGYSIFSLYYENSVADKSAQGQGRVESGMLDICVNNYQSGSTAQTMTNLVALLANITGLPSGTAVGSFPSVTYPNW